MKLPPKDLCREIPARAFINAQIIQKARSTPDFQKAIQDVVQLYQKQGLTDYQFENPAYLVSLLYCLLVVPKERWAKSSDSEVYREVEKHDPLNFFRILKASNKPPGSPTYRLIYRLRNAVAHAHYTIDPNMFFTFWDMPPGKIETEWEAGIDAHSMMTFLSQIGSILASEGLAYR